MTPPFVDLVDLASERLGGSVLYADDEFFASKDNLLKPGPAIWREGEYTDRGKWMDGWETRRTRNDSTLDHCIISLGARGIVHGVDVDTSWFKGNFPESCEIFACALDRAPASPDLLGVSFFQLLPRRPLAGDTHNYFAIEKTQPVTHLSFSIFPDGGVARLRVYGEVVPDWDRLRRRGDVDLAAVEHGGVVVACSDSFFGSRHNLIMPGDATHMGDGWETKRRRGPGHDWTIIRLGAKGMIRRAEIDTRHFKGNAPGSCSLEAARIVDESRFTQGYSLADEAWQELLPRTALRPHARHDFEEELRGVDDVTHVRFNIYPDGGVGRLRLFGRPS